MNGFKYSWNKFPLFLAEAFELFGCLKSLFSACFPEVDFLLLGEETGGYRAAKQRRVSKIVTEFRTPRYFTAESTEYKCFRMQRIEIVMSFQRF